MRLRTTTYEQRSSQYEDVVELLSPGFLSQGLKIGGVSLQLRSLSQSDLFLLRARTSHSDGLEWKMWSLATSIWMINGRVLLGEDSVIPLVYESLRTLPQLVIDNLFSVLLGLWVRSNRATDVVTVYALEQVSRVRWRTMGLSGLLNPGLPGSDRLGLNLAQRLWVAYNESEDDRHEEDSRWENAKFIASGSAPKAISSIDEADRGRRAREQERRQRQLDLHYYRFLGLDIPEDSVRTVGGPAAPLKSVETLQDEMSRWVAGELDDHDRVVEEYKDRLRVEYEAQKVRRQEQQESVPVLDSGLEQAGVQALTAEQLDRVLAARDGGFRGVRTVFDEPSQARQEKYLRPPVSGNLEVIQDTVRDRQSDPRAPQTLAEQVQARRPTFQAGR